MTSITFCLYIIAFGIAVAFAIAAVIFVAYVSFLLIQFIYQLPFMIWYGWSNASSTYPVLDGNHFIKDTKYATVLYSHWLFHKELDF